MKPTGDFDHMPVAYFAFFEAISYYTKPDEKRIQ